VVFELLSNLIIRLHCLIFAYLLLTDAALRCQYLFQSIVANLLAEAFELIDIGFAEGLALGGTPWARVVLGLERGVVMTAHLVIGRWLWVLWRLGRRTRPIIATYVWLAWDKRRVFRLLRIYFRRFIVPATSPLVTIDVCYLSENGPRPRPRRHIHHRQAVFFIQGEIIRLQALGRILLADRSPSWMFYLTEVRILRCFFLRLVHLTNFHRNCLLIIGIRVLADLRRR